MTILEMLTGMNKNNTLITKSLDIIKDDFTGLVNDNYELTIDEKGELIVKIPNLEKKDEYICKSILDYQYPLVMCMRIVDTKNVEKYTFILGKFMGLYKDKLELFYKDVNTVDTLMGRIKRTKNNIDYVTYTSIGVMILGGAFLCIFPNMSQIVRRIIVATIVLIPLSSVLLQFTKEGQVKKIIDGYISVIKTDWYRKELSKQYIFLCNFMG